MSGSEPLVCVVEIPKGSGNKYEWDEDLEGIVLDRFLSASVVFPTDYGFLPNTRATDEEPLDALVAVSEPTFAGCLIRVKPIAVLMLTVDGFDDENVLCVPCEDPNWNQMEGLEDLPEQLQREIPQFFVTYNCARGNGRRGPGMVLAGGGARGNRPCATELAGARRRGQGAGQLQLRGRRGPATGSCSSAR